MDEQKKNSSKRFLIIYCLAIFVFAVALILIASFSQQRIEREADAIQDRLTSAEVIAADKQTRLDAVMTENSRLNSRIEQLEKANSSLTDKNEQLTADISNHTKHIAASQKLIEIINLKRLNKNAEFRAAKDAFERDGHSAFLSTEELEIYNSLK